MRISAARRDKEKRALRSWRRTQWVVGRCFCLCLQTFSHHCVTPVAIPCFSHSMAKQLYFAISVPATSSEETSSPERPDGSRRTKQEKDEVTKKRSKQKREGRAYRLYCRHCELVFRNRSELDTHTREAHRRRFICKWCYLEVSSKEALTIHVRRTHSTQGRFTCDECDKRFLFQSELTRHMVTHTGVRDFVCDVCGTRFSSKSGLRRHMPYHAGKVWYCPHRHDQRCPYDCENPKLLRQHVRDNHSSHHWCPCGWQGVEGPAMAYHMTTCPLWSEDYVPLDVPENHPVWSEDEDSDDDLPQFHARPVPHS